MIFGQKIVIYLLWLDFYSIFSKNDVFFKNHISCACAYQESSMCTLNGEGLCFMQYAHGDDKRTFAFMGGACAPCAPDRL